MTRPDDAILHKSSAFADASYSGVQIVAEYMKDRSDMIEAVLCKSTTGHRDAAIKGLWFRARAWMQSLESLNHTKHYQAISAANRALLEITVDLILLHYDKTNALGWKIYQWGISERMRSAEQIVEFYRSQGTALPSEYEDSESFIQTEKASVDRMRITLWPNKKNPSKAQHPARWTGSSDLFVDVVEADRLHAAEISKQLDVGLVEYYRTRYRRMNWQIHSGVAGFWDFPPEAFDIIVGLALRYCADLALMSTKIVLADFGFNEALPSLPDDWDRVMRQREAAFIEKMNPTPKE